MIWMLEKLSDVVDNEDVKNKNLNTLETKVKNKILDATTLIYINKYDIDKQNLEMKIGDVDKKYKIQVV